MMLVCQRTQQSDILIGGDQDRYHNRTFRVTHVVDGDTFDIDIVDRDKPYTRIRLWGVDTPEVSHGRGKDMFFGPEASAFAKEQLEGRSVHIVLVPDDSRGKYGRLLAYVHLERDGPMFNEMLLEKGLAYADFRFKHPYFDRFKQIETLSRRNQLGLWATITPEQMPAWRQREDKRNKKGH
jgi:micrococcal nuclease